MTQKQKAIQAIREFMDRERPDDKVRSIHHIYPRAYVVGRLCPTSIIVAKPWQDSTELTRFDDRRFPLERVDICSDSIERGDFCYLAYVSTYNYQQWVACEIEP